MNSRLSFFFFSLINSQTSHVGCLPYFQIWRGLSANVLHLACGKYRMQKLPKIHLLGTIAQLCRAVFSQLRHVLTIGKKLVKQQYLLHMVNVVLLTASSLCYCSDVAQWRPTKLCTMFGHLMDWYSAYTFSGALAPWQNFDRCRIHSTFKSCVLLYWQLYCTALQKRASAKLCGMVQRMELWNFCWGHHLYSAGQPSQWALAYILLSFLFRCYFFVTFTFSFFTLFSWLFTFC